MTGYVAFAQSANDEVTPQVQELYAQAKAAQQRGDDSSAIQKYRDMLKLAPHLAPAYNNLGILYFNQHDYANAAQVLEEGLKLNPDMPTATAMLGLSYVQMGENEKAEPLLESDHLARQSNMTTMQGWRLFNERCINLGRKYDEATPYLKSHLEQQSKRPAGMVSPRQELSSTFRGRGSGTH